MEESRTSGWRNEHAVVKVKMTIVKRPVREGGTSEQRRPVIQCGKGFEHKGVRDRGRLDVASQGEIKGVDNHGVREDGSIGIILGSIKVIFSRKSIGWSHLCTRGNLPDNIKVLDEEGPMSLLAREFVRIFQVGQVLVVGEDRNGMGSPLQILFPFCKDEDDSKEFLIIDVIISFSNGEGLGKVSAGMKISSNIRLH